MEQHQFDELTRKLARPLSRRAMVKAVAAAALGGLFPLGKPVSARAQGGSSCGPCPAGSCCDGGTCVPNR